MSPASFLLLWLSRGTPPNLLFYPQRWIEDSVKLPDSPPLPPPRSQMTPFPKSALRHNIKLGDNKPCGSDTGHAVLWLYHHFGFTTKKYLKFMYQNYILPNSAQDLKLSNTLSQKTNQTSISLHLFAFFIALCMKLSTFSFDVHVSQFNYGIKWISTYRFLH